MPVMKANSGLRAAASAIVMDLSDLEREADAIVTNARAAAARVIAEAKMTAEREGVAIRGVARKEGHQEGFAAGMEEGKKSGHDAAVQQTAEKLAGLMDRWSKTLDILHQHMPAHIAEARTDLVRLSLAIAGRITHVEALRDRKVAEATLEDTMRLIGQARKIVLHVNPDEFEALRVYLPTLVAKFRSVESAEIVPDPAVGPGGCEASFGSGHVDARLETQLQRIADELLATDAADGGTAP